MDSVTNRGLLCEECQQPITWGDGTPRTETYGGGPAWEHCDCSGSHAKHEERNAEFQRQHEEFEASRRAVSPVLDFAGLRKLAASDNKAAAQERQEATLKDRELAVKDREIARRERRQNDYDADAAPVGDTLADYAREVSLLDVERLPSAFERTDGETLLYEGRFNTLYGEAAVGKTWTAQMVTVDRLRAGRREIWWDSEDRPETLAKRLQLLRATDLIGHPNLKWITGEIHESPTAMAEALEFLDGGNGPGLVVIDSATSFGCPADGADVTAWLAAHINPWWDAGHTVLLLDHVPKQRKDRPRGGIGSQVGTDRRRGPVRAWYAVERARGRPYPFDRPQG